LLVLFQARPRWWLVPATYMALLPLDSLRNYIFVGLALIIPISVAVTPRRDMRERTATATIATALSVVLLVTKSNPTGGISSLSDFDADAVLLTMRRTAATFIRARATIEDRRYYLFTPFEGPPFARGERLLRRVPLGGQYVVAGSPRMHFASKVKPSTGG